MLNWLYILHMFGLYNVLAYKRTYIFFVYWFPFIPIYLNIYVMYYGTRNWLAAGSINIGIRASFYIFSWILHRSKQSAKKDKIWFFSRYFTGSNLYCVGLNKHCGWIYHVLYAMLKAMAVHIVIYIINKQHIVYRIKWAFF